MAESSPIGQKTPWEKEKLLVMSKRLVLRTRKNKGFFGKGLKKTFMKCFTEQDIQDQTARFVQPDLNPHRPRNSLVA